MALVVGDLVSKDIGPRSKVWTEREKLEAAAWEFSNTGTFFLCPVLCSREVLRSLSSYGHHNRQRTT